MTCQLKYNLYLVCSVAAVFTLLTLMTMSLKWQALPSYNALANTQAANLVNVTSAQSMLRNVINKIHLSNEEGENMSIGKSLYKSMVSFTQNLAKVPPKYTDKDHQESTMTQSGALTVNHSTILAFLYRRPTHPHVGPRLMSVRDPDTGDSCEFTYDHRQYGKAEVVFIPANLLGNHIPKYRPPGQKWIFCTRESFVNAEYPSKFRFSFNHTMTYHLHADIDFSKGGCIKKSISNKTSKHLIENKNKKVVWLSSHCKTQSRREIFVARLANLTGHENVDIYGDCGDKECSKKLGCDSKLSEYKFFIALENSICNGYITEKVYNGLALNTVPLVAGAGSETYKATLPPHSYIDVGTYKSTEALLEYLQLLNKNDTLYQEYFTWKADYDCGFVSKYDLSLRTCRYLHAVRNKDTRVVDLKEFYTDDRAVCESYKTATWLQ